MNSCVTFHRSKLYQMVPWKLSPPFSSKESGSSSSRFLTKVVSLANPPMQGSTAGSQTPPQRLVSTNLNKNGTIHLLQEVHQQFVYSFFFYIFLIHVSLELYLWRFVMTSFFLLEEINILSFFTLFVHSTKHLW